MKILEKNNETIDLYPSRIADKPSITPRHDLVVYDNKKNYPLNEDQLQSYEKEGFLFFESLFNQEEINSLILEVTNLKSNRNKINPDYIISEPESKEIRSFFYIHEFNKIFRKLSQNPKIVNIAKQILDSDVYIHQSRINLKPGFKGKEFYWHSDFETWHVEDGMPRMRALSCSINLTDNNEFNGPLMVIPGSHKKYISCVGQTPENHYKDSLKKQEYGVPDDQIMADLVKKNSIKSPKGKAGSVIFFDGNIMHGSNSNITPYPRSNIFFVYNSAKNILDEPFGNREPRPEYIANRNNIQPL